MTVESPSMILSKEKIDRRNELQEMNKQNKDVIADLDVVLESFDNDDIAIRREDFGKKIDEHIAEIKKISFEKAVIIDARYRFAEELLSQLKDQPKIFDRIKEVNKVRSERISKHEKRYGIDSEIFYQKLVQQSEKDFSELDKEIEKNIRAVQSLQKLVENDGELKDEYIKLLAQASEKLTIYQIEKDEIIFEKTKKLLKGLPFSENLIVQINEFQNELSQIKEDNSVQILEEIDWEIVPSDGREHSFERASIDEGKKDYLNWKNYERIDYIKGLSPQAIYSSKQSPENRSYNAYEFDNCIVFASIWTKHAVYVIPNIEGWQDISEKGKKELRFRGAIVLKQVDGWKDRLEKIITGEIAINIDANSDFFEWSKNKEELTKQIRDRILENFPDLEVAINEERFDEAKDIVIKINFDQLKSVGISMSLVQFFGLLRDLKMQCFPDLNIQKEDIPNSRRKKFKWKTREESIRSFRNGIFESFPEIKEALDQNDLESVEEYLLMIDDDDLIDSGLRIIPQGKNHFLKTRKSAMIQSFPEIATLKEKWDAQGRRFGRNAYNSDEEKFMKWGQRLRIVFLEKNSLLQDLLKNNPQKAKILIMQMMEKEGGPTKFLRSNINGINGVHNFGGNNNKLKHAFPEIQW